MLILQGFQSAFRKEEDRGIDDKINSIGQKENKKIYHYWTDWHIANRRPLAGSNVAVCSNNNHGLNSAKDSSAGL